MMNEKKLYRYDDHEMYAKIETPFIPKDGKTLRRERRARERKMKRYTN